MTPWLSVESWELLSSSPQPMQSDGTRAEIMFMGELIYKIFINIVVWSRVRQKPTKRNEAAAEELCAKCKDFDERDTHSAKASELFPVERMWGKQRSFIILDTFESSIIMLPCAVVTCLIKRIKY